MRKLFRPASLLFYLLAAIVCFAAGFYYAIFTGAGAGQGLASAAIVLMHGAISGTVALLVSVVIVYYSPQEAIGRANRILFVLFLVIAAFTAYRYYERKQNSNETQSSYWKIENAIAVDSEKLLTFSAP
ncbi:MAG: hypothetical protein GVY02_09625 [Bacteroidetes bacterium]|jgi:hypothetical protein|nr:hypothetical protein [Bacteroidota bacterium]